MANKDDSPSAINVLRGLNKAPAGDHNNSDTEHDESQAGGIGKCAP
jgi:hypothetical protein